jgi:hypothetical protein
LPRPPGSTPIGVPVSASAPATTADEAVTAEREHGLAGPSAPAVRASSAGMVELVVLFLARLDPQRPQLGLRRPAAAAPRAQRRRRD